MSKQSKKAAAPTLHKPVVAPKPVAAPTEIPQGEAPEQRSSHGGVKLDDAIRVRAYQLWDRAGRPEGCGDSFWLEAESELKASPSNSYTRFLDATASNRREAPRTTPGMTRNES